MLTGIATEHLGFFGGQNQENHLLMVRRLFAIANVDDGMKI